jgi:hypothetical protein
MTVRVTPTPTRVSALLSAAEICDFLHDTQGGSDGVQPGVTLRGSRSDGAAAIGDPLAHTSGRLLTKTYTTAQLLDQVSTGAGLHAADVQLRADECRVRSVHSMRAKHACEAAHCALCRRHWLTALCTVFVGIMCF